MLHPLPAPCYLGTPAFGAFGGVQGGVSYEDQIRQILTKATEIAGRTPDPWRRNAILGQALLVYNLLTKDSDDLIVGPWGPATCLEWGRYDAGAMQRTNYRMLCLDWSDALARGLDKLADLLAPVDAGAAEVAQAAHDQARTIDTQANVLPTSKDLWENMPTWVKALLIGGAAVLAVKVVADLRQIVGAVQQLVPSRPQGPRPQPRGFIQ